MHQLITKALASKPMTKAELVTALGLESEGDPIFGSALLELVQMGHVRLGTKAKSVKPLFSLA